MVRVRLSCQESFILRFWLGSHRVYPYAIQVLQDAGYMLVTLTGCLGQQPYQSVGSPGVRDVWFPILLFACFSAFTHNLFFKPYFSWTCQLAYSWTFQYLNTGNYTIH
jgi:hypothetical protein